METTNKTPQADVSLAKLKGVGTILQSKLAKLGIHSIIDLLFFFPVRYVDKTRISPISTLRVGERVQIQGVIQKAEVRFGKRRTLWLHVRDASGQIQVRFFYFNKSQQSQLVPGQSIKCFGEVRKGRLHLEMVHPQYQIIKQETVVEVESHLTAVYASSDGIQQKLWENMISQALAKLRHLNLEWLPDNFLQQYRLYPIEDALQLIHGPEPDIDTHALTERTHPAFLRFACEELLAHHLCLRQIRNAKNQTNARPIKPQKAAREDLLKRLPFSLTSSQKSALNDILDDMSKTKPMARLLQGDVGSGKTVVATMAAFEVLLSGYQVAFMVPTEILAEQHFSNIQKFLADFSIEIAWLSSSVSKKNRKLILQRLQNGDIQLLVGTHAIFQEDVSFDALGLVIIDEQHRFGVDQRLKLQHKVNNMLFPHQLVMSATPIPRTLAMTFFADLEISIIDEMPKGRKAIQTVAISKEKRQDVIERVRHLLEKGQQCYWVCPLIEASEHFEAEPVEHAYQRLHEALPDYSIEMLHGKMSMDDKNQLMQAFKAKQIDMLVATTVIEVGIDVPNTTLMVIENAERLGLSQLHQLRGRVGRGDLQSYCILLYQGPLSYHAQRRLAVMRASASGFDIAKEDLKLRGPGDVLGIKQTGAFDLKVADLSRDYQLLQSIPKMAKFLSEHHPEVIQKLINRWIPKGEQYARV